MRGQKPLALIPEKHRHQRSYPETGIRSLTVRVKNGQAIWAEALKTLEQTDWKADYVITHCAPTSIAWTMNRHYQPDVLTDFLELVNKKLDFHCWLCGHYHDNRKLTDRHILLYEQIVQIN